MASPMPVAGLQGGPPPSSAPNMPAQPMSGLVSGDAGAASPGGGGGDVKAMLAKVVKMAGDIDQALHALAGVYAADGGDEIGQAKQLVQAGTAKFLGKFGQSPASNPTEAGSSFPGGGLSSNP